MMSGDSKSRSYSESLLLDDSEEGVIIRGITDDSVAAKSGLRAGDEIVAATIHLDHLNKNEVLNILKVLEPYDNNMKVLTKKELSAGAGLGSLGLGLKEPAEMFNPKTSLSVDPSAQVPVVSLDGPSGQLNAAQGLGGEISGLTLNGDLPTNLKAPDVSGSVSQLNIENPEMNSGSLEFKPRKFTMPHFNLPQINTSNENDLHLSAPTLNPKSPSLDLHGTKVEINGPDANFEPPKADIEASSGKIKWPHLKWKGPKLNAPDASLNADLPAAQIHGDLPEADINLPKCSDPDVQTPDLDIDATSGRINWPHLKWRKPKLHGPKTDLDLDANVKTPDVDVSLPKVKGEINSPDVDINVLKPDINGPDVEMQTPNIDVAAPSGKIHWPHLKRKKPKIQKAGTCDFDLPAPESDINLSNAELNLPKADLKGCSVDADIDAPSSKIHWPHLKWKKPKLHGPNPDMNIDADLSAPDVDLSLPRVDGEIDKPDVDLNLPKADVGAIALDADTEAPSGKIKFPTIKKPKFLLSGPKIKTPDADFDAHVKAPDLSLSPQASVQGPDVDVNLPKADVDLNLPKADVDVKAPNVDVETPSGKFKWPTLKKPRWSISRPKINGADVNADAEVLAPELSIPGATIDSEIDTPDANVNLPKVDLESPKLNANAPDVDGSSGIFKWFRKSKSGTLKADFDGKVPDMDLKEPDVDTDLNISMPSVDAKGLDVDPNGPDIDLDSPDGGLKLSKLKLPKFKMNSKDVEPNADLSVSNIESGFDALDLGVNLPKADLKGPNADVQALEVELPKADVHPPDVSVKATNVDVNLANADLKGPDVQFKTPDLDSHLGELKLPHFKQTKLGVSSPEIEVPSVHPSVELGTEAPKVNIGNPTADANIPVPVVDSSLPKVEADVKGLEANVKAPNVDASVEKPKLPHFKLPKLNFSGPNIKAPAVDSSADLEVSSDVKAPSVGGEISSSQVSASAPEVKTSLNTPELNITTEANAEVKGSPKSKLRWPFKWGLKSDSGTDDEGSGVDSETDVSTAEVEVPAFKFHRLPTSNIDGIGGIGDSLGLSKPDTEAKDYVVSKGIRLAIVNPTSKAGEKIDIMERLKMAKEKTSSANVSPTEVKTDIDLKPATPSFDVSSSTEAGDSSLVRAGTFKIEKPESLLGPVAPEGLTSDENDKLSLSLSNMLGLNIKDSDAA